MPEERSAAIWVSKGSPRHSKPSTRSCFVAIPGPPTVTGVSHGLRTVAVHRTRTSPGATPAFAAGESGLTLSTTANVLFPPSASRKVIPMSIAGSSQSYTISALPSASRTNVALGGAAERRGSSAESAADASSEKPENSSGYRLSFRFAARGGAGWPRRRATGVCCLFCF